MRDEGDWSAHRFIVEALHELRPDDKVLSEEGMEDRTRLGADRVWIVDPLDGTREFGEPGRSDWAVHVALVDGDRASRSPAPSPSRRSASRSAPTPRLRRHRRTTGRRASS